MTPGQALKELVTLANRPQGIVWRQLQPHHRQQVAHVDRMPLQQGGDGANEGGDGGLGIDEGAGHVPAA